jgi:hypothetical protein
MKVMIFDTESGHYLSQLPDGKCSWVRARRSAQKLTFSQGSTWLRILHQNCRTERYTLLGDV